MAEAKQENEWTHTAHIIATILNVNRGKGQKAVKPSELMPGASQKTNRIPMDKESLKSLAGIKK